MSAKSKNIDTRSVPFKIVSSTFRNNFPVILASIGSCSWNTSYYAESVAGKWRCGFRKKEKERERERESD